jgi:hypothetical protein
MLSVSFRKTEPSLASRILNPENLGLYNAAFVCATIIGAKDTKKKLVICGKVQ